MEKKISFLVSVMCEMKMCAYNLFFLSPDCKESRSLRETKRKMSLSLSLCSLFPFLQKCPTFEIASFIPFLVHFLSPSYPLPWGEVKPLFSFLLSLCRISVAHSRHLPRDPTTSPPPPSTDFAQKRNRERKIPCNNSPSSK